MAHVDVVPVEGQPWTVPPFELTEKDGFLYGRGVSDDKGMASAIVAIVLELARTRATLARDLIVALTAGEESDKIGVRWLVEHRAELIDAELALDEGGAILAGDDQSRVDAVEVSATEKITQNYRLVVKGAGGHSALPPTDTNPTVALARALERVAAYRFPPRALPDAVARKEQDMACAHDRKLITAAALIAATCGPALPVVPGARSSPDDPQRLAIEIGDRVRSDQFEVFPEYPTALRPPGATFDGLHDDSIAAVAARAAKLASWQSELLAIDPSALAGNTEARLSYQVAREVLEGAVRERVCREELWTVSPAGNGWPARFTTLVELQPVGTDALRAQALARLGKMGSYVDAQRGDAPASAAGEDRGVDPHDRRGIAQSMTDCGGIAASDGELTSSDAARPPAGALDALARGSSSIERCGGDGARPSSDHDRRRDGVLATSSGGRRGGDPVDPGGCARSRRYLREGRSRARARCRWCAGRADGEPGADPRRAEERPAVPDHR